jgi:hypothetical protein
MPTIRATVNGLALLAVVLGGCVSAAAAEAPKTKADCIVKREINAIRALDDKHVFVKTSADRNYLFTTDAQCPGLTLARTLAISGDTSTRVCEGGVSMLAFEEPATGPMRCRIATITPVRDKDAAEALIASEQPPK